uniref:Uncharacterized protein n=1 Tax=Leersia perrieri TaxID=77586 RepID=A0A0D9VYD5_9ORYZ
MAMPLTHQQLESLFWPKTIWTGYRLFWPKTSRVWNKSNRVEEYPIKARKVPCGKGCICGSRTSTKNRKRRELEMLTCGRSKGQKFECKHKKFQMHVT